ncbi:hypothetical protein D9615_002080 [Tricholomella constricta]|uniref:N-acetyltransferase domain-containing protein n=1 Tax=Tricholomella constricta TaxID=117010 RepID=A0A8H5HP44_9AGAR|nr:hypothetical protein D9615_002080 [Tricholomella constricta]
MITPHPLHSTMAIKALPVGTAAPKNGICIRYFRRQDSDNVRDLFLLAMSNGPGSPRRLALNAMLTKPAANVAYALIIIGLSITYVSRSPTTKALGCMLSILLATVFLGYRHLLDKSFTDFYAKCLTEDLADIASHYRMKPAQDDTEDYVPSGPSGFWVVECELPDKSGAEIIGCVGLDSRYEDDVLRGRLCRLNVSPYHRRKGIAALLVQTLLDHAREHEVSVVDLTTTHFQEAAIVFYGKLGWVEVGRDVIREAYGLIRLVLIHFRMELDTLPLKRLK